MAEIFLLKFRKSFESYLFFLKKIKFLSVVSFGRVGCFFDIPAKKFMSKHKNFLDQSPKKIEMKFFSQNVPLDKLIAVLPTLLQTSRRSPNCFSFPPCVKNFTELFTLFRKKTLKLIFMT